MSGEKNTLNILDYGAEPGTGLLCTAEVQAALDEANAGENRTVVVPAGEFLVGTLDLGSASLLLEKGAVLKGSPNLKDYRYCGYDHNEMGKVLPLLYSLGGKGISLRGEGTIDMSGDAFFDYDSPVVPDYGQRVTEEQKQECTVAYQGRPNQPLFFHRCNDIIVEGLTIVNAPCWTFSFCECRNVRMLDLNIDNSLRIPNNDGMHFSCCKDVLIRGCIISAGDDCIALTAVTDWSKPCEDFVISDCILKTCSKAIAIGYMHSIVRNVSISNIIIRESNRGICIMSSAGTGLVENVTVSNVQIDTRVRAGNWWGNGEPIYAMATRHNYERYALSIPERSIPVNVRGIRVRSALCRAENAIAVVGESNNIRDIRFEDISVEMKESANMGVKGKVIDLSPSVQIETLPQDGNDYWLHLQDCEDVTVRCSRLEPFHGKIPMASLKDCAHCSVSFEC